MSARRSRGLTTEHTRRFAAILLSGMLLLSFGAQASAETGASATATPAVEPVVSPTPTPTPSSTPVESSAPETATPTPETMTPAPETATPEPATATPEPVAATFETSVLSEGANDGLACEAGHVYAITEKPGQVIKINTGTGEATRALESLSASTTALPIEGVLDGVNRVYATSVNALAISPDGLYSYYSIGRITGLESESGTPVFRQDNRTGATTLLGAMPLPTGWVKDKITFTAARGGINPTDGIYWVSASRTVTGGFRHFFWAYNTITGKNYGWVGSIDEASTAPASGGDLVFDQDGKMILVTSSDDGARVRRVEGMKADQSDNITVTSNNTMTTVATIKAPGGSTPIYHGVTFGGDGLLWTSFDGEDGTYLQAFDPNTGDQVGTDVKVKPAPPTGSAKDYGAIVDLSSCIDPGGLRLQNDYEGRIATDDNVALSITRKDDPDVAIGGATVTTTGPATGLQGESAVVMGVPGEMYRLTESAVAGTTALTDYSTTLSCVDTANGDAPQSVTKDSQGVYDLTFPAASVGSPMPNIVCTYTNAPKGFTGPSCEAGYVYSVNDDGSLQQAYVDPDTGDADVVNSSGWPTPLTEGVEYNGLGVSSDGSTMYAFEVKRESSSVGFRQSVRVYSWKDGAFGTEPLSDWWLVPNQGDQFYAITGAVNPVTGQYVFGGFTQGRNTTDGNTTFRLYGYSPDSGFSVLGQFPANTEPYKQEKSNSDIAFDAAGNLYVLQSQPLYHGTDSTTAPTRLLTVPADGDLSVTASNWLEIPMSAGEGVVGLAFGGDGTAYVSSKTKLYRFNPATWEPVGDPQSAFTDSSDLASCTMPPTLTVQKDVVDKRSDPTDQFSLSASQGGVTFAGAVTAGDQPGIQKQQIGPLPVYSGGAGATYDFGETLAAGSVSNLGTDYTTTWTCTDTAGNEISSGDGATGTVKFTGSGLNVTCVLKNTPKAQFKVIKQGLNCDTNAITCPLGGAAFALYDTDPSTGGAEPIVDGITADEVNGSTFTSKKLTGEGPYWLVETKAPAGHELLSAPIKFTIGTAGIILPPEGTSSSVAVSGADQLTLVVSDATAAPLPQAGGAGPWPFYVAGLLLLMAAGLYYNMTSVRPVAPHRVAR